MYKNFSSHIQLQYLLNKHHINTTDLHKEMNAYYGTADWVLNETKYGKVTGVKLAEGKTKAPKPAAKKPFAKKRQFIPNPLQSSFTPQPTVVIKKRRSITR
jgi:hypothetical protein